jgi:zinc protease
MFIRRLRSVCTLVIVGLVATFSVSAEQSQPLTERIPVDPAVTVATLPNGLRYYIKSNPKPENRGALRLVVNAGSVLESDDQRGLAHFVEHMAFNGTRNFPKLEIVNFMQSIGMRFGPSVNAFTSFDETVYMLEVPTENLEVVDRALLILEDWARDVTFDPAEIEKERGVILEEWRLGRGAQARMQDKQFPVLLGDSRYAERLPIGKPEVIQSFTADRLIQYYKDWYRPDLMAVIAVGDFDKAAIEPLIRKHFESMPARADARPRDNFAVPAHARTRFAIATDPEARSTSVSVYHTTPAEDETTIGAYRKQIVEGLFSSMLNARFSEIAQKPNAPFLNAGGGFGRLVRTADASSLSATVRDGGLEAGLEALFTEAERVARFGFTATELDRQKTSVLRRMERLVAEKDNQESGPLASEYSRNYLTREPIPGIVYEQALHNRFVPEITLAEVNALARDFMPDASRVVVVSAPDKPGVTIPGEATLAGVMSSAAAKTLTAYEDTVSAAPLLEAPPRPGTVVRVSANEAHGTTEWALSNGARVILKPTTFKQDEVVFSAYSFGGTSLAPDADFMAAETADQVVGAGGLGNFTAVDLRKVLTGKAASVSASIDETTENLSGGGSPKDLLTLFELIHLRFTQPRRDPAIFSVLTDQMKASLANQAAQPEFAFSQALSAALWRDHPRARPMTSERVAEMNLDKSFSFYRDRFADAGDFTFVFVGSFDLPTMRPLVERYIASLPASGRTESWRDVGMRPATGVVERRVNKGIEPKSQARLTFSGTFQYDQAHRVAIRAMAMVLETRLRESLREDLGGTYSVGASASYWKIPVSQYMLSIGFGSAPDRTDALIARVFEEIELLKKDGPTSQQVADVKAAMLRDYETTSRTNGFYLREIAARHRNGENLDDLFGLERFYNGINASMVQEAARQYLDTSNYVKVTLFPER